MAEGMKRIKVGQETRMADIPADAGAGMGAFENLHGHEGGSAFARHITGQAASVYGAPGRAWLEWLTTNADTLKARIRASAALAAQIVPEAPAGRLNGWAHALRWWAQRASWPRRRA
jgi:putative DNA primase/helicase